MSMSAVIAFGIGLLLLTSKPADWIPELGDFIKPPDPVLVVVVGSEELVGTVRSAISSERVLAETSDAFALDSLRVIAASADAAGGPINELGWIDREIEIVSVPTGAGRRWENNRHQNSNDKNMSAEEQAKADKIASIMKKPKLNAGEAMMLLQHMDSTGQF